MKIGYLSFGRDDFSYGLALVLSRIKDKCETFRVSPKTARYADEIFFSLFWWEHLYLLADFLRKAGISKNEDLKSRPRIRIGGYQTFNPVPLLAYGDEVFVGDGEEGFPLRLFKNETPPSLYLSHKQKSVEYACVESLRGFSHITNDFTRVEIARGCRYRCKFCLVSHLKPYREVPIEELRPLVRRCKTKRISLFAPEVTAYSSAEELDYLCAEKKLVRSEQDTRIENVHLRQQKTLPQVGIEGISERLRKSVRKNISDEILLEQVARMISQGKRGLRAYYILGLPGETSEDWDSFKEFLVKMGNLPGAEKFSFFPYPNAFNANPHTPFEMEPVRWEVDYRKKWTDLFFLRGCSMESLPWKMKIMAFTRMHGPASRILAQIALRAGEEFFDLERDLSRRGVIRIQKTRVVCKSADALVDALKKWGGVERYCGVPKETPWKKVKLQKPKEKGKDNGDTTGR